MQVRWTKGLTEQQATDLRLQLKASMNVFNRLEQLLQADLVSVLKAQESKEGYDSPSWAMNQADSIGEIRAYKKILRLINIKDSK